MRTKSKTSATSESVLEATLNKLKNIHYYFFNPVYSNNSKTKFLIGGGPLSLIPEPIECSAEAYYAVNMFMSLFTAATGTTIILLGVSTFSPAFLILAPFVLYATACFMNRTFKAIKAMASVDFSTDKMDDNQNNRKDKKKPLSFFDQADSKENRTNKETNDSDTLSDWNPQQPQL